jgi:glyoxylase-like metal-dependent hydrolase (beta-lactamase superfamily II)
MHLDHVGGLPDFPDAQVHIFAREYEGITQPRTLEEKYIYRQEHWSHNPNWIIHELGDEWFGLPSTPLIQLSNTVFTFIPLTGHTRGHSAVALKTQDGWLLHCGDSYVYHGDTHPNSPYYPPKYHLTLTIMGLFSKAFRFLGHHSRKIRKLLQEHGDEVRIFCSHDPLEFARFSPEFNFNVEYRPPV